VHAAAFPDAPVPDKETGAIAFQKWAESIAQGSIKGRKDFTPDLIARCHADLEERKSPLPRPTEDE
jgi:hypothetical protein